MLAHIGARDSTRYSGGDQIALTASGLPANTSLLLLFDGPRWKLQETIATKIPYSAVLGIANTDANGSLQTAVRLPDDAMYGAGKIEAFERSNPRTGAVHTWNLDTHPHAPWIDVSAPSGTQFNVCAGHTPATDPNACGGSVSSSGKVRITVNPGVGAIHFIGSDGGNQGHLTLVCWCNFLPRRGSHDVTFSLTTLGVTYSLNYHKRNFV